ncbi:MAG: hypothetical protein M0023_06440 [Desulfobacteraceae bacterium]|nr:hypothetical protein [Desulfobacteraceae bacterium]
MKHLALAVMIAGSLVITGCSSSNFLVYKDSKHYYVTSKSDGLRKMLCESGDLAKITKDAALSDALQKELHDSICASTKVKERVLATLESMTKEQRTALKLAFQLNGYEVNTISNC